MNRLRALMVFAIVAVACTAPRDDNGYSRANNGSVVGTVVDALQPVLQPPPPPADNDGDGWWDPPRPGDAAGDCDDADPDAHPGAEEICNHNDDDCDEEIDEVDDIVDVPAWPLDHDGDFWGAAATAVFSCELPEVDYLIDILLEPEGTQAVFPDDTDDCDEADVGINPGIWEDCGAPGPLGGGVAGDGLDNDCDGEIDEDPCDLPMNVPIDEIAATDPGPLVPLDDDNDGVNNADDCAPDDPDIYPGAFDPPGDGIDQNCDTLPY